MWVVNGTIKLILKLRLSVQKVAYRCFKRLSVNLFILSYIFEIRLRSEKEFLSVRPLAGSCKTFRMDYKESWWKGQEITHSIVGSDLNQGADLFVNFSEKDEWILMKNKKHN